LGEKEQQIRLLNRLKRKAVTKNQVKRNHKQAAVVVAVVVVVESRKLKAVM
jgi:hypothetical protein